MARMVCVLYCTGCANKTGMFLSVITVSFNSIKSQQKQTGANLDNAISKVNISPTSK